MSNNWEGFDFKGYKKTRARNLGWYEEIAVKGKQHFPVTVDAAFLLEGRRLLAVLACHCDSFNKGRETGEYTDEQVSFSFAKGWQEAIEKWLRVVGQFEMDEEDKSLPPDWREEYGKA